MLKLVSNTKVRLLLENRGFLKKLLNLVFQKKICCFIPRLINTCPLSLFSIIYYLMGSVISKFIFQIDY